ncbi:MAG: diguanylate cyclase [Planctomycetota bacterium]
MPSTLNRQVYLDYLRASLRDGLVAEEECRVFGERLAKEGQDALRLQQLHLDALAELVRDTPDAAAAARLEQQASLVLSHTLLAFADHLQKDWHAVLGDDPQARLDLILEAAELGTWSWNLHTRRLFADDRFHDMHGGQYRGQVIDRDDYLRRVHPGDVERVTKATFALLVDDAPFDVLYRVLLDEGEVRHIRTQASLARDEKGVPLRMFGVCLDITESHRAQRELEELSRRDPLTGVLNRRGLTSSLEVEVDRRRRSGTEMQALFLDLDDFKKINDVYGHSIGDEVLMSVSRLIRETVRASDHVARIGGDEFLIILPNTNREEARPVADKIHKAVSGSVITEQFPHLRIGSSLGMVSAAREDEMVQDLLVRTERALHSAKRYGKGQVFHENNLFRGTEEKARSFTEILEDLHDPSTYFAVKQKLVRVDNLEVCGFEFLTRSHCSALRSPEDFLRFAMDAGIANVVDLHAFATCSEASFSIDPALQCHLNLLPSTLEGSRADDLLKHLCLERDLSNYCIEISEKESVGDPRRLLQSVDALREVGIRIALDDIGYGHSSLEALILLEPEVIKVDRALVSGIHSDAARRRAFESLLRVVGTWNGEVVAEGVESQADLDVLRDLQVPYAQGFLFGQPE